MLTVREINRGFNFQAGFANKFGCLSRLTPAPCYSKGPSVLFRACMAPAH